MRVTLLPTTARSAQAKGQGDARPLRILAPTTLSPIPSVGAVAPVSAAPGTGVSHVVPMHPYVPASIPAIVAADPYVAGSGPSRHGFIYWRRRTGLNVNVRLSACGGSVHDGARGTQNGCKKKLPHNYLSCPRVAAANADASCYPAPGDFERSARTLTALVRRRPLFVSRRPPRWCRRACR
jgi:hypothetical protein